MKMTSEQALQNLAALVNDERLRFLNKREIIYLDQSLQELAEAIKPKRSARPKKKE